MPWLACPAVPNGCGSFGSGWYVVAATSCSLCSARILFGLTLDLCAGTGFSGTVGQAEQWHTLGGEDIEILLFLLGSFLCAICGLWSVVSLHVGLFMVDYFVERHGGVKGDEQDHVAIRVD